MRSVGLHSDALCIDAAAPLITPETAPRRLPELEAAGIDAVLATVASIEDATNTLERLRSHF
jgi:hypothetical protein